MIVEMLKTEEAKLGQRLSAIRNAITALEESNGEESNGNGRGRWGRGRKMSPETKAKISRAAKARFAMMKVYKKKHPRSG